MPPVVQYQDDGGKNSGVAGVFEKTEPSWSSPPPPPLRFSSYSLLEGGDTAVGSLGLPTGVLFAPFSRLAPPPPRIPRQPILCTSCLAYPSPFSRVDSATGGWSCCFCGKTNPCYTEDFIGSSPAEHRDSYPDIKFVGRTSRGHTGGRSHRIFNPPSFCEMTYKAVEYAEEDLSGVLSGMSSMNLATGRHRKRDRAASAPAHVFVLDGNMRGQALAELARSVDQVLRTMAPEALISLVVFTGVVSVYRLGRAGAGAAVAEVLPGAETLMEEELDRRLSKGDRDHFLPVHAGREALVGILKILRGVGGDHDRTLFSDASEGSRAQDGATAANGNTSATGGQGQARRRPWGSRRVPVPEHRRRRCLGAAVEYAVRLAKTAGRPTSRLLVCLGGCPNFGPGAVAPCAAGAAAAELEPEALAVATEYFKDLGKRALRQGTGVDVFCGGSEALGAAALQGLVAPTGGYVVIQPSFGVEFAENLIKSITEQCMSDGDGLHGCVMDVRTSPGVELMHVVGPAESTEDYDAVDREAESASASAARTAEVSLPGAQGPRESPDGGDGANDRRRNSHHRLLVGRCDPRTTLALYFDGPPKPRPFFGKKRGAARSRRSGGGAIDEDDHGFADEEGEHVVFQFVIRRASPAGDRRITRVVTHRLPVTDDDEGFLKTVDPEALAILVGKEAVLRATCGIESGTNELEVEEARVAVDTVVEEVSARFRDLRKILSTVPGSGSRGASGNSAGLRRGADGGRRSSGGGVPGEGAEPSLADAEGGLAGGFGAEGRAPPAGTAEGLVGRNSGRGEREEEEVVDGPEDLVFPRELGGLPRQLFHLRRGPLLGPLLQNSDDPLCLRHLFLRGSLEDCLRMMAPEMFSLKAAEALSVLADGDNDNGNAPHNGTANLANNDNTPVPVPPQLPLASVPVETLAMLADRILILDTHDRIFVWSGVDVCGPEYDEVRRACERKFSAEAASRFPAPRVVFLKDGTSWSRYLTSRLIPSHKDPVEDQLRGFPELAGIPPAEIERLRTKLPPTDDESYREFFWDVCDSRPSTSW